MPWESARSWCRCGPATRQRGRVWRRRGEGAEEPTGASPRSGGPSPWFARTVPWLWVCLSPGVSLVYCTPYLSISWRHAARFLAGAVHPPSRVRGSSPAAAWWLEWRRRHARRCTVVPARVWVGRACQPVPSLWVGRRRKEARREGRRLSPLRHGTTHGRHLSARGKGCAECWKQVS